MSSTTNLPDWIQSSVPRDPSLSEKDRTSLDAWVSRIQSNANLQLESLEKELTPLTYLVSNVLTAADVALYAALHSAVSNLPSSRYYALPALTRWFDHIQYDPTVRSAAGKNGLNIVEFDIEGAPKLERKTEPPVKKEKKEKEKSVAGHGVQVEKGAESKQKPAKESVATKNTSASSVPKEKAPKQAKAATSTPANEDDSKPIPSMIDLRVGHIIDVKKHPDADGLYVEQIDLGEPDGPRTVVSGLVNYIPIEQMRDRWLIAVCNLKPVAMRGVKSYAMVLCATSKEGKSGGIEIVEVPEKSRIPGERIYFEGFEDKQPLAQLNPKKKIFETIQPGFITLDNKDCAWVNSETKSVHRIRTKDGICVSPSFVGATLS